MPVGTKGGDSVSAGKHHAPEATTPRRWYRRLQTRNWRVRTKLAAVVNIPLIGFLLVAVPQVAGSVRSAIELDTFTAHIALTRQVTDLVHELQRERDRTTGLLAALGTSTRIAAPPHDLRGLASERAAVDQAAQRLDVAVRPLLDDEKISGLYRQARAQLDEVPQVREGVAAGWLRTQAAFDTYSRIIAGLLAVLPAHIDVQGGVRLDHIVHSLANLPRAKELTAQIRGQLYIVSQQRGFEPGAAERIATVQAEQEQAIARFRVDADPDELSQFDDVVTGQAVHNTQRLRRALMDPAAGSEVDPQQWWAASTTELELMHTMEQNLLRSAIDSVEAVRSRQILSTTVGAVATVALLLLALVLSMIIGREMSANLRSLRLQALRVAQHRLPDVIDQLRRAPTKAPPLEVERIEIASDDEIGEVAESFTAVHESAVRLAAEQAEMRRNANEIFTKLALRSQTLVERQLKLLDSMESNEIDPDQLAKLFRLDHLATRLRRNDDNLLVLAGADSSRRWTKPVDLSTLVLAASAEVEQYARVRQDVTDAVYVVGYAVADLISLVAELLENATSFSPPQTPVIVEGKALSDGGAELVVTDSGIGMSARALAEANTQVTAPVSIDISAAERMGLVVVGHLAKRHGIQVKLSSSEEGGVTVHVGIPASVIMEEPPEREAVAPQQARRLLRENAAVAAGSDTRGRQEGAALTAEADSGAALPPPAAAGLPRLDQACTARARTEGTSASRAPSIWWSPDAVDAAETSTVDVPPLDQQPRSPGSASTAETAASEADVGDVADVGLEAMSAPTVELPTVTSAGLPMRRRMAHLPAFETQQRTETVEADPDAVGDMLSRLYSGMRRAEAEAEAESSGASR